MGTEPNFVVTEREFADSKNARTPYPVVVLGADFAGQVQFYTEPSGLHIRAVVGDENGRNLEGHVYEAGVGTRPLGSILFQNGPVLENGVNGLTNEAMLAILIHRTEFLDSKFPCAENKLAIESMKDALWVFNERTKGRVLRGVEGTLKA